MDTSFWTTLYIDTAVSQKIIARYLVKSKSLHRYTVT